MSSAVALGYAEPRTVDEAVDVLSAHGEAAVVAGGTDLVVGARAGRRSLSSTLVAIHRIAELRQIELMADGATRIGALVTHAELERGQAPRLAALADAAALIGSPATRNVGTLGGNLANGSPAMETGSPLLVLGAEAELRSRLGRRLLPIEELLQGPHRTALERGELLTHVAIPRSSAERAGSAYVRLQYRQSMEIAVVGAATLVELDGAGRVMSARVALTAVAPTCILVPEIEAVLAGRDASPESIEETGRLAALAARPIDDIRAPADYRRAMVPVVVRRSLERALERARGGGR